MNAFEEPTGWPRKVMSARLAGTLGGIAVILLLARFIQNSQTRTPQMTAITQQAIDFIKTAPPRSVVAYDPKTQWLVIDTRRYGCRPAPSPDDAYTICSPKEPRP